MILAWMRRYFVEMLHGKRPVLRIQRPFGPYNGAFELEGAKCRPNFDSEVVMVAERRLLKLFYELRGITNREDVKGKRFAEAKL
jgi:hypothetical protein